jgi:hypothetical protein
LSIPQVIERIENANAWILLKRTNRDPRYAAELTAEDDRFPGKHYRSDFRLVGVLGLRRRLTTTLAATIRLSEN